MDKNSKLGIPGPLHISKASLSSVKISHHRSSIQHRNKREMITWQNVCVCVSTREHYNAHSRQGVTSQRALKYCRCVEPASLRLHGMTHGPDWQEVWWFMCFCVQGVWCQQILNGAFHVENILGCLAPPWVWDQTICCQTLLWHNTTRNAVPSDGTWTYESTSWKITEVLQSPKPWVSGSQQRAAYNHSYMHGPYRTKVQ